MTLEIEYISLTLLSSRRMFVHQHSQHQYQIWINSLPPYSWKMYLESEDAQILCYTTKLLRQRHSISRTK